MIVGCSFGIATALASSFMTNFWAFVVLYACGFGVANGISVTLNIINTI